MPEWTNTVYPNKLEKLTLTEYRLKTGNEDLMQLTGGKWNDIYIKAFFISFFAQYEMLLYIYLKTFIFTYLDFFKFFYYASYR